MLGVPDSNEPTQQKHSSSLEEAQLFQALRPDRGWLVWSAHPHTLHLEIQQRAFIAPLQAFQEH